MSPYLKSYEVLGSRVSVAPGSSLVGYDVA